MKTKLLKLMSFMVVMALALSFLSVDAKAIFRDHSEKKQDVTKSKVVKRSKKTSKTVVAANTHKKPLKTSDAKVDKVEPKKMVDIKSSAVDKTQDGVEKNLMASFLKNDFPEKTDFIEKEDVKSGDTLGVVKALKNKAVNSLDTSDLSMSAMFARMGLTVLALTLVLFVLAFIWKFLQGKSGKIKLFKGQAKDLSIISQQIIAPKSKILLVEALGKKFLVGATEHQINLISDMDFYEMSEESGQDGSGKGGAGEESKFDFADALTSDMSRKSQKQNVVRKGKVSDESEFKPPEIPSVVKRQASQRIKDKLKRLKRLS